MSEPVSHALMFGSMLSNLRLWCGETMATAAKHDLIADTPETMDCPECARMMSTAGLQLDIWLPRLKEKKT